MPLSENEKNLLFTAATRRNHPDIKGFVARTELIDSNEKFGHKNGIGITGIRAAELKRLGLNRTNNIFDNVNAAITADLEAFERFDNSIDRMHVAFLRGYSAARTMPKEAQDLVKKIDKKADSEDLFETNLHTETKDTREAIDKGVSVPDRSVGQTVEEIILLHLERGNIIDAPPAAVNTVLSEIDQIGNGRRTIR